MSLEMAGSRLLAPTFGSSIYVWGALIIVVMAALTLGYYYGGRIADRYPNLAVMGVILTVAGLTIGFLPFWAPPVNYFCSGLGPRTGPLFASLYFFFIPGILLATISPYGIKLAGRNLTTIGYTAGRLSAISSAGSIVGTLITSFFLIPIMGVSNIIHSLGLVLFLLASFILCYAKYVQNLIPTNDNTASVQIAPYYLNRAIFFTILALVLLSLLWIVKSFTGMDKYTLYERDSLYHHILVKEEEQQRILHFDNSYQSAIDLKKPLNMLFDYTSYLHLGVVAHPQPVKALFIGLGGGLAPYKFFNDYQTLETIDIVEIDPEVVKVAKKYFRIPSDPKLHITVQDGRLFVEKAARKICADKLTPYDIIIIDAYNATSIPFHLTTYEFLQSVRKILAKDGVVVSNIIGAYDGPGSILLRSMTRTFKAVFPETYLFPVGGWNETEKNINVNVILIATMNTVKWDGREWQRQAQNLSQQKIISENVQQYSKMLVKDKLIQPKNWLKDVPLLTDDYAPVDTLQNPL